MTHFLTRIFIKCGRPLFVYSHQVRSNAETTITTIATIATTATTTTTTKYAHTYEPIQCSMRF